MSCATAVVARVDGGEFDHTVGVGLLDATKSGAVQVRSIGRVSVAVRLDTRVDSSRVAVPDIEPSTNQRLASVDVDELSLQDDLDSRLAISHVRTNVFTLDVERTNFALWVEDSTSGAVKDVRLVGQSLIGVESALVVFVEDAGSVSLHHITLTVGVFSCLRWP